MSSNCVPAKIKGWVRAVALGALSFPLCVFLLVGTAGIGHACPSSDSVAYALYKALPEDVTEPVAVEITIIRLLSDPKGEIPWLKRGSLSYKAVARVNRVIRGSDVGNSLTIIAARSDCHRPLELGETGIAIGHISATEKNTLAISRNETVHQRKVRERLAR